MMTRWLDSLFNWMNQTEAQALERYLAQSANVADLERRMRDWEKNQAGRCYLQ